MQRMVPRLSGKTEIAVHRARCVVSRGGHHRAMSASDRCTQERCIMGKGDNKRGNKEIKKPKQEKAKVSATANSQGTKPAVTIAGKNVK